MTKRNHIYGFVLSLLIFTFFSFVSCSSGLSDNNNVVPEKPSTDNNAFVLTVPSRSEVTNEVLEYHVRVLNISGYLLSERIVKASDNNSKTDIVFTNVQSNYYNGALRLNITAKDSKNIYYNDKVFFSYFDPNTGGKDSIGLTKYKPIEEYYNTYVQKFEKGFKVIVPTVENANIMEITRINKNNGSEIKLRADRNKKEYIDNYLEPDTEYTYIIRCDREDCVLDERIINVKAPADSLGEIKITNKPKATFNSETGLLTFEELPKFNIDPLKVSYHLNYVYYTSSTEYEWGFTQYIYSNTTNLSSRDKNFKYYNKDLKLLNSLLFVEESSNGWTYSFDIRNYEGLASLDTINVKDTRFDLEIKNATDGSGIEIKLLPQDKIPEGTDRIYIGRERKKDIPYSMGDMPYWYINTEDLTKDKINDIFVRKGQEYIYTLYYRDSNNNILHQSKPTTFTSTIDTLSSIINDKTTITYSEETDTATYSPIDSSYPYDISVRYLTKNGDRWENRRTAEINKEDGNLKWETGSTVLFGEPYYLEELKFYTFKDKIRYGCSIYKEELSEFNSNFTKEIIFKQCITKN